MVGGIIPLRRATSSRYDGRLGQESAQERPGRRDRRTSRDVEAPNFAAPASANRHVATSHQILSKLKSAMKRAEKITLGEMRSSDLRCASSALKPMARATGFWVIVFVWLITMKRER